MKQKKFVLAVILVVAGCAGQTADERTAEVANDQNKDEEFRWDCSSESERWATNVSFTFQSPKGFTDSVEPGTNILYGEEVDESGNKYQTIIARIDSDYAYPTLLSNLRELDFEHSLGPEFRILANIESNEETGVTIWKYAVQYDDTVSILTSYIEVDLKEYLRCFYVPGQPHPDAAG